jgi:uncharacterized protein
MISRRKFLRIAAGGAAGALGLGFYAWQVEPHWLELVRRPMPIAGLPARLKGCTLVQLSDIHVGPRVSDSYVRQSFEMVRALSPDIVVYTGDFVSYEADVDSHAGRVYRDLPRGRLETVGVLGNHDYGPGFRDTEVAASLVDVLRGLGLNILRNEVVEVEGLQIAGLDDLWAKQFRLREAMEKLDPKRAAIALSHNPDTVDLSGWDGFEGWILSGHTHGGQCKPPFLPPFIVPVKNKLYTSGVFELVGNRRLYISRGMGHSYQVRFNARPEVTVFELQPA